MDDQSIRLKGRDALQLGAGKLLPALSLPVLQAQDELSLRKLGRPYAIVLVHGLPCPSCEDYVRQLERSDITTWGGRVAVVVPHLADCVSLRSSLGGGPAEVLLDPDRELAAGDLAVVVADEWGELFFAAASSPDHDLPAAEEVAEWIRFVAVQCPECEGPEGAWRELER